MGNIQAQYTALTISLLIQNVASARFILYVHVFFLHCFHHLKYSCLHMSPIRFKYTLKVASVKQNCIPL